jgi:excisionase family DNA binding protein
MRQSTTTNGDSRKRAFTIAEAAEFLGCHRATLHRMVQAGKLKTISGFGVLKVSDIELDRFLSNTAEYRPKREVTQ